jgi:hypothetical protein
MSLLDKASLIVTPNAYKESKLYSIVPNTTLGDMDVVRATTATRVNSAGLIEVVPRNLVTYSEQFDNAAWTKINLSIIANATTAPNGTLTADKIVENTSSGLHRCFTSVSGFIGSILTYSIYLKAAERNWALVWFDGEAAGAYVDLSTGQLGTVTSGITASVESVGNGWYRCVIKKTIVSSANIAIYTATNNGGASYTGNGTSGIFAWGAQLEANTTATEYFPTTTRLNIPRIDYTNGSCPSLLVEPQRTNLLTYSNTFSNAAWVKLNCSVASNSIISPDGTQNSTTLTSSVTNTNFLYNAITTANGLYTLSCFVKYLDTNTVNLSMTDFATGDASATFNFNTGLFNTPIVGGSWTNTTTNVITLTNGWFKISITSQKNAGLSVSSRINSFAVGKSVYLWGAQLELGSYPTSYIPTVASTVTRNTDVISKTGISSLIGQTEGTIFIDTKIIPSTSAGLQIISLDDNSSNNRLRIITATSSRLRFIFQLNGGLTQYDFTYSTPYTSLTNLKIAIGYKSGDIAIYINGIQVNTSSNTLTFSDSLSRFIPGDGSSVLVNSINLCGLFLTRLTNDQLAQLTTL